MGEAAHSAAPAETSGNLGRAAAIAARLSRQIRVFRCGQKPPTCHDP